MPGDPLRIGIIGVGAVTLRGILPHLSQDDLDAPEFEGATTAGATA